MKNIIFTKIFSKDFIRDLIKAGLRCKYAIITDSKVKKLYGTKLKKLLNINKIKAELIYFQEGEKNKNLKTLEKILKQLSEQNFHRDDCIIALGGGVAGDIAGFAASIYMRGMPYIQIPTTLLAMVDSSVGGKTGVNMESGKNMIGTFYKPKKTYIDVNFLKTLPEKEFKNGIAEIIKYGMIKKPGLLKMLGRCTPKNNNRTKKTAINKANSYDEKRLKNLLKIIKSCLKIKSSIVNKDLKENNLRKILNYGHTIGHAIEKASGYKISHGEAVSIGMVLVNNISVNKKILRKMHAEKFLELIKSFKLPYKLPNYIEPKDIIEHLAYDKKISGESNVFIIPKRIGAVLKSSAITKNDILKACRK